MNADTLQQDLRQFTGSMEFARYSAMFRNNLMTEGTNYLAEKAGCYWLFDAIDSWLPEILKKHPHTDFIAVKLKVQPDHSALLRLEDGNDGLLAMQEIEYTDFPLPEIMIFTERNELGGFTHLLPSEH